MSKANTTSNTSRRGLLAASGVGAMHASVALPIAAAPAIAAAHADPVLALYAKWRAVEDQRVATGKQHKALRADFVQRYGEFRVVDHDVWSHDPQHAELGALTTQCNQLADESTGLIDAMQATPATSIEGIQCKMLVALDVWKFIELPTANPDYIEYQDTMTVAFLRDAARVLGGSAVA